jgi:hypothetical protein
MNSDCKGCQERDEELEKLRAEKVEREKEQKLIEEERARQERQRLEIIKQAIIDRERSADLVRNALERHLNGR